MNAVSFIPDAWTFNNSAQAQPSNQHKHGPGISMHLWLNALVAPSLAPSCGLGDGGGGGGEGLGGGGGEGLGGGGGGE